jgi:hypothetical protein
MVKCDTKDCKHILRRRGCHGISCVNCFYHNKSNKYNGMYCPFEEDDTPTVHESVLKKLKRKLNGYPRGEIKSFIVSLYN